MKHFVIIMGTRPEVIKLLPVYLELRSRAQIKTTLVFTGQHREIAEDVFRTFECTPDVTLDVMEVDQTLAGVASRILSRLAESLPSDCDLVIVQGDTVSAFIGSLLAFYRGIPCAHVEAGLRSGELYSPFPEEFNRRAIAVSARWHFAPTEAAAKNLEIERINGGIHVVGNTGIDAALMIAEKNQPISRRLREAVPELIGAQNKIILVTMHRRENFGSGVISVISAVRKISVDYPDFVIVWPVHPNPNVRRVVNESLAGIKNIRLIEPLGYSDLLYVLRRAFVALSDSGGIQEEAPSFSCPVLVLRDNTERPEAVEAGCNIIVGTDEKNIIEKFNSLVGNPELYRQMIDIKNPYGDGKTSQRIADVLISEA